VCVCVCVCVYVNANIHLPDTDEDKTSTERHTAKMTVNTFMTTDETSRSPGRRK